MGKFVDRLRVALFGRLGPTAAEEAKAYDDETRRHEASTDNEPTITEFHSDERLRVRRQYQEWQERRAEEGKDTSRSRGGRGR